MSVGLSRLTGKPGRPSSEWETPSLGSPLPQTTVSAAGLAGKGAIREDSRRSYGLYFMSQFANMGTNATLFNTVLILVLHIYLYIYLFYLFKNISICLVYISFLCILNRTFLHTFF